jgi:hypothetical protein
MRRYAGLFLNHQHPKTQSVAERKILMVDDHEDIPLILSER